MSARVVATAYGGPEVVSVVEVDLPGPGPGEVSVEVMAAATNPIDVKLFSGAYGRDPSLLPMPLGLEVAGVDMLESRTGPKIMEVNSSPGFEGLEGATGLDIAGEMIAHAVRRAHEGSRAPPGEPTRIC